MKLKPTVITWKTLGIPALAAGFAFFASPVGTDANELGDKELSIGAESSQVEELQELLEEEGLLEEENINGTFDEETADAVKDYQDEHELRIDGIAGPHTIGALEILGKGDDGEPVKVLQVKLNSLGFYDQKVDGKFGPNTHDAVIDFQKSEDILIDGLAGPQTFGALVKAINNSESSKEENSKEKEEADVSKSSNEEHSEEQQEDVASEQSSEAEGRTLQVEATAYTANCSGCSGVTATGVDLNANPDANVIAVDPDVIPLGSKVKVEGHGTFTAADTGGAINGNKIDIFMPNKSGATSFGRQSLEVTVLE
ncbi:peptidoglycan-binding protein [Alteribacillus bidgolensis]|uniref:3D (Asp-Asp-Asp) domain-containing protein n=1 Tax=Alteribacillus bidgolensis TaxID=930129 RepID=A0A1G8L5X4_9BACI|nr:peptidoglycan-binding protein [Alteribacillus bidgolensis]SDI51099.1 3D (Asp-Asp-Asp) domain-containing protein [Alteribacillus bidgolensis]